MGCFCTTIIFVISSQLYIFFPAVLAPTLLFHLFGVFLHGRRARGPCLYYLCPFGVVQCKKMPCALQNWRRSCSLIASWWALLHQLSYCPSSVHSREVEEWQPWCVVIGKSFLTTAIRWISFLVWYLLDMKAVLFKWANYCWNFIFCLCEHQNFMQRRLLFFWFWKSMFFIRCATCRGCLS